MKRNKKFSKLNRKVIFLSVAALIVAGVLLYVKNFVMVNPQVALVEDSALCTSNVAKFAVKDECSAGTFSSYSVTCLNGNTVEKLGAKGCYDYFSAYQEAQNLCGKTCQVTAPSPTTSSTSRPTSTIYPTPRPSATSYTTPLPTYSSRPTPYPSTTGTPTPSAPPACYAQELTHYAYRGNCTDKYSTVQHYNFIDYTCGDETTPRTMGSADSCQFETSLKSGAEFYCRKNVCTSSTTVPAPTQTPSPTIGPGCYTQTAFCFRSYIGGTCPTRVVCPSPTPTPSVTTTSTPSASSTAYPTSSSTSYPSPTYGTTPPPTSDPSPLVSCETEVYKLPARLDINNLNSLTLAKFKVNARNIVAKQGDRYAFNMNLTNIKNYPLTNGNLSLSAWSSNSAGESTPYDVVKAAPSCQVYPDKTVRCGVGEIFLGIKQSIRPDTYMIVDIGHSKNKANMSIGYQGIYSASNVSCPSANITIQGEPSRRCYGYGYFKWCRNVYIN